ncbi:MAG: XRE family transcriptional regulator [Bacteroidaceae bacterium]|nr:XRE family transcriptional regulator [Bacteroidaceae bacterium]
MNTNHEIRTVAKRLRALREDWEYSLEYVAEKCGVSTEELHNYESGDYDIPMNFLCNAAHVLGVQTSELLAGETPNMSTYWLVRKGQGESVVRHSAYKYRGLALGFKDAKASPFIVTVDPEMEKEMHLNSHEGQEFNLVLKGTLLLNINGKELILNEGDSVYFNATLPHGMKALNDKPARFFAIII